MTKSDAVFTSTKSALSDENYRYLQHHVYQNSGIVLDNSKHYLLESRLLPIVRSEGLSDLNALCGSLRRAGQDLLRNRVVEAMTTNETLFFRDKTPFDALRQHILPDVVRDIGSRPLRVWSAAASTGQEAYSIAMLLAESGLSAARAEILGTDLSDEVLTKARTGSYSQLEVNRGLPATCLVKHFTRKGITWEVNEDLRRMVRFQQLDLRKGVAGLGRFDIVFCRNVLIYFDMETKRTILGQIYKAMHAGSYLLLGAAETTLNVDERFVRKTTGGAVIYQKSEAQ